ncbi:MAG: MFS transporter, partial [Clostridia bacterium]|nr:MFS transporter [Clostridia bacterium]
MEQTKRRGAARAIAWVCALAYFTSYVLRKNLGVMLVKVCSDMGVAESALAVVLTGLTITYGTGQLISGVLGDKVSPIIMIAGGLGVSSVINGAFYFVDSVPMMTVLWCINGFAHSMIWAPMVKLFSVYLADHEYNFAIMRVMWGSAFATIFLRVFCPAMLLVTSWRTIMLITAIYGAVIAAGFFLSSKRVFAEPVVRAPKTEDKPDEAPVAIPLPAYAFAPVVLIIVSI